MLVSSALCATIYVVAPAHYNRAMWFRVLLSFVAEFAVLIEISNHVFKPYIAIRQLGRLLTAGLCALFSILYILPPILKARPWDIAVLSFAQETALAKGLIVVVMLFAAHYFRLPLGKNVSGMVLGFAFYLAVSIVTFTAAIYYGRELFENLMSWLWPWSYDLCLLVWVVTLWRYDPIPAPQRLHVESEGIQGKPLSAQLGQFNALLTRSLRK